MPFRTPYARGEPLGTAISCSSDILARVLGRDKLAVANREPGLAEVGSRRFHCVSEVPGDPEAEASERELDQESGGQRLDEVGGAARSQDVEPGVADEQRPGERRCDFAKG